MKDDEEFKKALADKQVPILVLDEKWHRLFAVHGKPDEIHETENELNALLARQGKLNEELKQLKKVKKQLMESIVANMDGTTSEDMDAQREKKLDEDKRLIDDKIIEVDWEGNILWSWRASDHFDQLGFDEAAKNALFRNPCLQGEAGGDWMHINCVSVLGENKWYDAGDERFHPDNLIFDARNANILAIISKKTGEIVWQIGPDFSKTKELCKLGWIIGQHHFHMIPKGLPGEGNLLVFDNGGEGGYGNPNPSAPTGNNNAHRDYSRVLEFDPITLEIIWQYTPLEAGNLLFTDASKFYSSYISSAQRLPNGNTLITEGSDGHLIEVTPEHEIVWEYVNPYFKNIGGNFKMNMVYRAYRTPYEWVPQATHAEEVSIEPLDVETFRVPGASKGAGTGKVTVVAGVDPNRSSVTGMNGDDEDSDEERLDFCVASVKKGDLKEE